MNKRKTLADLEAESLETETSAGTEPAAPRTTTPSKKKDRTPKSAGVIAKPKITEWPQIAARVPPELRDAYVYVVNSGQFGAGRDVVTRALEDFLLQIAPFNEYTEDLHQRHADRRRKRDLIQLSE